MRPTTALLLAPLGIALSTVLLPGAARAEPCPVGLTLEVDNDDPGSGYSEESPENWQTHNVDACAGTYRYLSKYVGDGSTDGKATWKPAVGIAGIYSVTTSFRASENRTDDADYTLFDDQGGSQKKVVSQVGDGCTEVEIGQTYCAPGGDCRLVLDGTDDMKSDAADITTFVLVACDEPAPGEPKRCDGIRENPAYEVCEETDTTCEGVFTDGAGCTAYCAAAGMTCVASYGGEPGCSKEANNPLPCDADTGHASDWCECEGPPLPGSGGGGGGGGAGGVGGSTAAGGGGGGGSQNTGSGGSGATGGVGAGGPAGTGGGGAASADGSSDADGCACTLAGSSKDGLASLALGLLVTAWAGRRRRQAPRGAPR